MYTLLDIIRGQRHTTLHWCDFGDRRWCGDLLEVNGYTGGGADDEAYVVTIKCYHWLCSNVSIELRHVSRRPGHNCLLGHRIVYPRRRAAHERWPPYHLCWKEAARRCLRSLYLRCDFAAVGGFGEETFEVGRVLVGHSNRLAIRLCDHSGRSAQGDSYPPWSIGLLTNQCFRSFLCTWGCVSNSQYARPQSMPTAHAPWHSSTRSRILCLEQCTTPSVVLAVDVSSWHRSRPTSALL
jgi:hypothetical protein